MNKKDIGIFCLFALLIIIIFRSYFFDGLVPFPANLLVSFYQPWVSYSWQGYPNGPPSKPLHFDALRLYYPIRHILQDELQHGQLPLWNPYYFSGNPLLGTYQSAVFHPLSILFFLFSQIDAWSIIILLQPFIAGIGMYLFLREFGLQRNASVFGAVGFAFSGIMIAWWEEGLVLEYSFLFLPYVYWAIYRMYKRRDIWSLLIGILAVTCSILSGSFQMTFYISVASLFWALVLFLQDRRKNVKVFIFVIISFIEAILLSCIQLLPSFEAYLHSLRRTTIEKTIFDSFLSDWKQLITYISPDYFGNPAVYNYLGKGFYHEQVLFIGIPLLLFAVYELLHYRKGGYEKHFITIMLFVSLILGFSSPVSWFLLFYLKPPIISEMTPSRIFFLSMFFLVCLGAFGLQRYISKEKKQGLMLRAVSILAAFFVIGWITAVYFHPKGSLYGSVSKRNMVLPTIFFAATVVCVIIAKRRKWLLAYAGVIGIISISIISMVLFADKYLSFSERRFVFPSVPVLTQLQKKEGFNRFWSIGDAHIYTNLATYYKVYSPEGYDSFNIDRYNEFAYASHRGGLSIAGVSRADATLFEAKSLSEIAESNPRQKSLSLLGVKYIIAKQTDVPLTEKEAALFQSVWSDGRFSLYEYKKALPRVFLVDSYEVIDQPLVELQTVYKKENNLRQTLFLEEKVPLGKSPDILSGNATISMYLPNEITITTNANKDSLVFLSDTYYPGWKAFVDAKETKIYRADYAFRAAVVPKGKHIVRFVYQPMSFTIGLFLTIIGLIILPGILFLFRKITTYKKGE